VTELKKTGAENKVGLFVAVIPKLLFAPADSLGTLLGEELGVGRIW
jgi:hypothetical protein